jgi:hypothetical protein
MCFDTLNGKLKILKWTVDKQGTEMGTGLNLLDGVHWGTFVNPVPQRGAILQIS